MKFKKLLIYSLPVVITASLSSCNDFLELNPISQATTANAYQTASDAEAAITGVYDSFSQDYYIWDNVMLEDVRSDNYYAGGDNNDFIQMDKLQITPTNSKIYSEWSSLYNAILKANVVIQKVPQITDSKLSDTRKTQIIGEAYFLRAYHYFQLVKLWGGVPLITEPMASTDPGVTNVARSTEDQVYDQIVADLQIAVTNLPDTYSNDASVNKARATKGAANALLAKVYAQRPTPDYSKVLEYCNAVINSPAQYSLIDYNYLFDGNHYNNAESIMEIQFNGGTEANWGPQMLLPPSLTGDTWRKFVTPSKDLVRTFDSEGDSIRKHASILFENAPWADEYWSLTVGGSIPFAYKWKSANGWASTNRQYIFRLGDIILLKAEALNELGRTAEAKTELDKIRSRVNLSPSTATSQADLRLAIEKERRLELAQEAQRWDDLRRYKRVETVMNNLNEIDLRTNQKVNYNMTAEKELLPIPQQELNRNSKLTQNPGY